MGRSSRSEKEGLNKGAWTADEDQILMDYVKEYGEGKWGKMSRETGLKRCGKSCRLRWLNYLRPDIKRGNIEKDEEDLIIRLHKLLGNRWALIAGRLPGRTDNEIKNYWNSTLRKKTQENCTVRSRNQRKTIKDSGAEAVAPLKMESHLTKNGFTPTSSTDNEHLDTTISGAQAKNMKAESNGDSDTTWNFIKDLDAGQLSISEFLHTDFSKLCELNTMIVDCANGCRNGSLLLTSTTEASLYSQELLNNWAGNDSCLPEAALNP